MGGGINEIAKMHARPHLEEQPGGFDQFLQNLWYFVQMENQRHTSKPCSVYLSLFFIYLN